MKVGIIGCGKIAQTRHLPEYSVNPYAEIAGCYDFNFERARQIAEQYGGKAYSSIEELLGDPQIDAVSVCVSNNAHAEISVKALKAGKHVLCEKPMATNLEDCENMVKMADQTGKYLMIGQNQRLVKAHRKAKELIRAGEIGKVLTFKTTFGHGGPETWSVDPGANTWFFDKKRAVMGAMADLGVHKTDLLQFLFDTTISETTAVMTTLDKRDGDGQLIGVDDNAICIYKMKNGIIGTMTASWTYYGPEDNSTVIYGTEGIMRIFDNPAYSIELYKKDGDIIRYNIGQIQTNDHQTSSGIIDAFVDAVVNGHEPEISGKTVLPAMKAVFASIASSQENRTIKIE